MSEVAPEDLTEIPLTPGADWHHEAAVVAVRSDIFLIARDPHDQDPIPAAEGDYRGVMYQAVRFSGSSKDDGTILTEVGSPVRVYNDALDVYDDPQYPVNQYPLIARQVVPDGVSVLGGEIAADVVSILYTEPGGGQGRWRYEITRSHIDCKTLECEPQSHALTQEFSSEGLTPGSTTGRNDVLLLPTQDALLVIHPSSEGVGVYSLSWEDGTTLGQVDAPLADGRAVVRDADYHEGRQQLLVATRANIAPQQERTVLFDLDVDGALQVVSATDWPSSATSESLVATPDGWRLLRVANPTDSLTVWDAEDPATPLLTLGQPTPPAGYETAVVDYYSNASHRHHEYNDMANTPTGTLVWFYSYLYHHNADPYQFEEFFNVDVLEIPHADPSAVNRFTLTDLQYTNLLLGAFAVSGTDTRAMLLHRALPQVSAFAAFAASSSAQQESSGFNLWAWNAQSWTPCSMRIEGEIGFLRQHFS